MLADKCALTVTQLEGSLSRVFAVFAVEHCDLLNSCPEEEPMTPGEECVDVSTDESLLETNPIQSPLQVFAGMGGLALITAVGSTAGVC